MAAPAIDSTKSNDSAGDAIGQLKAVFDQAIEKSAEITKVTTEKKTMLDATKQRPQN